MIKKMIIWFISLLFLILLVFNLVGFIISAPSYNGEVSDHFNGKKFINLGNVKAKGLIDVIRWSTTRDKQPWEVLTNVKVGAKPDIKK